jgi:hypothetical protein
MRCDKEFHSQNTAQNWRQRDGVALRNSRIWRSTAAEGSDAVGRQALIISSPLFGLMIGQGRKAPVDKQAAI